MEGNSKHRLMQEIAWEDMKTRIAIHKVCSYILRSLIMFVKVIYISVSFFVTLSANFVNMLCLNKENPELPLMAGQTADHLQAGPPFSKLGVDFFDPLKKKAALERKK